MVIEGACFGFFRAGVRPRRSLLFRLLFLSQLLFCFMLLLLLLLLHDQVRPRCLLIRIRYILPTRVRVFETSIETSSLR